MLAEVALGHALAAIGELVRGGVVEADAEVSRAKIGGDVGGELQRLLRGDLRGDADRLHVREFTRTPCETAARMCGINGIVAFRDSAAAQKDRSIFTS